MTNNKQAGRLFYTITQVAEIVDIKPHTIRFWESKISHLSPIKHNKRRIYTNEDIDRLRAVKQLIYKDQYKISAINNKLIKARMSNDSTQELKYANYSPADAIHDLNSIKASLEELLIQTERGAAW